MAMMRRRPSGAVAQLLRRRERDLSLEERLQLQAVFSTPEKLAVGARRLAFLLLLAARCGSACASPGGRRRGCSAAKCGERGVVGEQALPPRFQPPVRAPRPAPSGRRSRRAARGSAPDRPRASACRCTASGGASPSWLVMRFASSTACAQRVFEHRICVELRFGQLDQLGAERLQLGASPACACVLLTVSTASSCTRLS